MSHNFKNLVGQKFNRLLVIQLLPTRTKQGRIVYLCLCKCGNTVKPTASDLTSNNTRSCGCLAREMTSERSKGNSYSKTLPYGESAFRQVFLQYKADAKKRNYCFELTLDEARNLMTSNCFYCGIEPNIQSGKVKDNGKFTRNGIDRKDNSKGYTVDNVVPCCFSCNKAKWTQSTDEFKTWLTRTYNHINVIPQVTPSLAKWIISQ